MDVFTIGGGLVCCHSKYSSQKSKNPKSKYLSATQQIQLYRIPATRPPAKMGYSACKILPRQLQTRTRSPICLHRPRVSRTRIASSAQAERACRAHRAPRTHRTAPLMPGRPVVSREPFASHAPIRPSPARARVDRLDVGRRSLGPSRRS